MAPRLDNNRVDPRRPARKRNRKTAASLASLARWKQNPPSAPTASVSSSVSSVSATSPTPTENKLIGSRIMNLQNLSSDITKISEHSSTCTGVCRMIEEIRREGLASVFMVICDKCSERFHIETSKKVKGNGNKKNRYAVNLGAVWGQMATGGGPSNPNETAAAVDLPGIPAKTFTSIEEHIGQAWEKLLAQEITKAGEEEREIAIKNNDSFEGVPAISVTVDAGWSKRSHKHSYNAKSGVAVIIGNATKKLLFLAVRNKYCSICTVAMNKGIPPQKHHCYKNWTGSSCAMESDMIVEGFRAAESMHHVKYMRMVGDGDSSVLANIQVNVLGWGKHVTKIECANHAVKCYHNRLDKITQDFPKYKGRGKLTKGAIKRLTNGARCAIKINSKKGSVDQLRKDLRNGPNHVFNDHKRCSTYFCKVAAASSSTPLTPPSATPSTPPSAPDVSIPTNSSTQDAPPTLPHSSTPALTSSTPPNSATPSTPANLVTPHSLLGTIDTNINELLSVEEEAREGDNTTNLSEIPDDLYFRVQRAGDRLVSTASSLITNSTSNLAECFMGIRCKFDGGKVFNRIQRGSFQHRCYGAGLRFQLGPDWTSRAWNHVTGDNPGEITNTYYEGRAKQHQKTMKRKRTNEHKEKRKKTRYSDKENNTKAAQSSYGTTATQPEVSPAELHQLCKEYKSDLTISPQEAQRIEEETKQQSEDPSGLWMRLRRCRLTASNFGTVCKRRPTTPVAALVKNLVYKSSSLSAPSLRWGRENEACARKAYKQYMQNTNHPNLCTIRAGFVIHPDRGWLGCSPDDWVVDPDSEDSDGVAEYKCPYGARDMTPYEACSSIKGFFCMLQEEKVTLRKNHNYYHQVQGTLGVTGKKWCDFTVWTPKGLSTQRIKFDQDFWESMIKKLEAFFDTAILPELAAPQQPNGRAIRESSNGNTN